MMRLAGCPSKKRLEEFDFSAQPDLDRRVIDELATLRFVEERSNMLFIGQPGVGKTMLAIALGLEAIDAGHRVYYTTAAELVGEDLQGGGRGTLGGDDALLGRPRRSHGRCARPSPDAGRSRLPPLPGEPPTLREGRHDLNHQQGHCRLGRDLRGHDRRYRGAVPPTAQGNRGPHRRGKLPDARSRLSEVGDRLRRRSGRSPA
jgi:hypothetical protein